MSEQLSDISVRNCDTDNHYIIVNRYRNTNYRCTNPRTLIISISISIFVVAIVLLSLLLSAKINGTRENVSSSDETNTEVRNKTNEKLLTNDNMIQTRILPNISINCGRTSSLHKVLRGSSTVLFEFPWMALIAYKNSKQKFQCSGTLINEQYILTAAHCLIKDLHGGIDFIRLGEFNISSEIDCNKDKDGRFTDDCASPYQDIQMEKASPHPNFKPGEFHDDIGIIKLAKPAILNDHVKLICLPSPGEFSNIDNPKVQVVGYGLTEKGKASDIPIKADLHIFDFIKCKKAYRLHDNIVGQMCAGDKISNTCHGDSGGPSQILHRRGKENRYYQYGVISAGDMNRCTEKAPSLQINVEHYIEWINHVLYSA